MKYTYNIQWLRTCHEEGIKLKFIFFWGNNNKTRNEVSNACFSQWYESPFTVDGFEYKTAEHWMMAQKALLFNDQSAFANIIGCRKPGEAKDLGRLVEGFDPDVWEEKRFGIVVEGNIYKFSQNKALLDYLLQTDNRVLVEASPVDTIWGIGLSRDSDKINDIDSWRGENLLGFALMEARDRLRQK